MGHNKGISDKPIRLKIYSPNVLCASPTPILLYWFILHLLNSEAQLHCAHLLMYEA